MDSMGSTNMQRMGLSNMGSMGSTNMQRTGLSNMNSMGLSNVDRLWLLCWNVEVRLILHSGAGASHGMCAPG